MVGFSPFSFMSSSYSPSSSSTPSKRSTSTSAVLLSLFLFLSFVPSGCHAIHHMKRAPVHWVSQRDNAERLFRVTNLCSNDIYPAILTQAGTGPAFGGFLLGPGNSRNFTVSANWQGRIWARTNCSFNADGTGPAEEGGIDGSGKACLTGDCGGVVDCKGTVS